MLARDISTSAESDRLLSTATIAGLASHPNMTLCVPLGGTIQRYHRVVHQVVLSGSIKWYTSFCIKGAAVPSYNLQQDNIKASWTQCDLFGLLLHFQENKMKRPLAIILAALIVLCSFTLVEKKWKQEGDFSQNNGIFSANSSCRLSQKVPIAIKTEYSVKSLSTLKIEIPSSLPSTLLLDTQSFTHTRILPTYTRIAPTSSSYAMRTALPFLAIVAPMAIILPAINAWWGTGKGTATR